MVVLVQFFAFMTTLYQVISWMFALHPYPFQSCQNR